MAENLDLLTELYPGTEIVKWTELYRNPYRKPIHGSMLKDGLADIQQCKLKGEVNETESKPRIVIYDREYAIVKALIDTKQLNVSIEEWIAFFTEVHSRK